SIIAGAWNEDDPTARGIFVGRFVSFLPSSKPTLYMFPTKIVPPWHPYGVKTAQADMVRVSVASCESDPKVVYALCTGPRITSTEFGTLENGRLSAVLRSPNGGKTWSLCSYHIVGVPAGNSEYINDYGNNGSGGMM